MSFEKKFQNITILILIGFLLFLLSKSLLKFREADYFNISIVDTCHTDYHNIAVSKQGIFYEFFIDGEFLFSSSDVKRYAESIVIPPLNFIKNKGKFKKIKILFIGYPCGYTLDSLLKSISEDKETIIDFPVADMPFKDYLGKSSFLSSASRDAFKSKRINFIDLKDIYNSKDIFNKKEEQDFLLTANFLSECNKKYDFILINSPDPIDEPTSKWYDLNFYRMVKSVLKTDGIVSQQITSPFFTPQSLGLIEGRIRTNFKGILKFRTNIPSTGEWGFGFFSNIKLTEDMLDKKMNFKCSYLNRDILRAGFHFPKDKKNLIDLGLKNTNDLLHEIYFNEWQSYVKMSAFE